MDAGLIDRTTLDPLTHTLWGAFFHAGMYISGAPDRGAAQRAVETTLLRLFDGLRPRVGQGSHIVKDTRREKV